MKTYYFIVFIFISFSFIFYSSFRCTMTSYIKKKYKIGKNRMKKMRKGKLNQLWHEEFQKQYCLGVIYYINKLYTIFFSLSVVIHLLFGWTKIFGILFCILFCIANIFLIILDAFSNAQNLIEEFGTIFVFWGINKRKGIDSILFLPISSIMIAVAGIMPAIAMSEFDVYSNLT